MSVRQFVLSWYADDGGPDSIDFMMSDEQAHELIARLVDRS